VLLPPLVQPRLGLDVDDGGDGRVTNVVDVEMPVSQEVPQYVWIFCAYYTAAIITVSGIYRTLAFLRSSAYTAYN